MDKIQDFFPSAHQMLAGGIKIIVFYVLATQVNLSIIHVTSLEVTSSILI